MTKRTQTFEDEETRQWRNNDNSIKTLAQYKEHLKTVSDATLQDYATFMQVLIDIGSQKEQALVCLEAIQQELQSRMD